MSLAAREREIAQAAVLVPCATTLVRLRCAGQEVPFLFFQADESRIAVYDPATGTATADCTSRDVVALVAEVATRLGYRVDAAPAPTATLAGTGW